MGPKNGNTYQVSTTREKILGILSDTHGLLREAVLEKLRPCELIIHAGDIGNQVIIDQLRSIGKVVAVKGNVDRGSWSAGLKEWEYVDFHGKRIFIIHDIGRLEIDPKAAGVDVVVYGHSHRASKEHRNGVLYLNPGSAGPRRFALPPSIARLRLVDEQLIPEIINIEVTDSPPLNTL
jgi:putative phosphoesterase